MDNNKNFVCIICPIGCDLEVTFDGDDIKVRGNSCFRGEKYAIQEMTRPMRTICSTVRVKNGFLDLLPVKSSGLIEKTKIFDVMKEINEAYVEAPIEMGQVIIKNVLDSGVDIIASKSMKKIQAK